MEWGKSPKVGGANPPKVGEMRHSFRVGTQRPTWPSVGMVFEASSLCNPKQRVCREEEMANIQGTKGNDVLTGTELADIINGLGGNDLINGLGGPDN